MIVADTNLIAYLFLSGEFTPVAEKILQADPVWAAPLLWRSEFRNVLTLQIRHNSLPLETALQLLDAATELLEEAEYQMDGATVLQLAASSGCSAYDAEFVALAQELGAPLITFDQQLLSRFPQIARTPVDFLAEQSHGNP